MKLIYRSLRQDNSRILQIQVYRPRLDYKRLSQPFVPSRLCLRREYKEEFCLSVASLSSSLTEARRFE